MCIICATQPGITNIYELQYAITHEDQTNRKPKREKEENNHLILSHLLSLNSGWECIPRRLQNQKISGKPWGSQMILTLFIVNVSEAIPCMGQKGRHLKVIGLKVQTDDRKTYRDRGGRKREKVTFPTILSKIINNLLTKYISLKIQHLRTIKLS